MALRVRITAEATTADYSARYRAATKEKRGGRTLQSYLDEFDGFDGEIGDPFGLRHRISLRAFSEVPPETFVKLSFMVPSEGEEFPPILNEATVLKEYELPEGTTLPGV